jgi:hypothetical protein
MVKFRVPRDDKFIQWLMNKIQGGIRAHEQCEPGITRADQEGEECTGAGCL